MAERMNGMQTVVVIRHGEKPPAGLGLLTARGLNRALLLADWFTANFPPPDALFAPDPSVRWAELHGDGQRYDFVRALLTIGPTAVRFGVPVDTQVPVFDAGRLADRLLAEEYRDAVIYVAWEHTRIVELAEVMLARFGRPGEPRSTVPSWSNEDYDMVFIFTIDWTGREPTLGFEVGTMDLGSIGDDFPSAAR